MSLSKKINITVTGYSSKLSSELNFYQGDSIKLIISLNEFGVDLATKRPRIMPINPFVATLLIDNPTVKDYVESAEINGNEVVFELSKKHTQHIGKTKVMIVLNDDDGCEITIPEFQFEVRERLNIEGVGTFGITDTTEVDNSIIATAFLDSDEWKTGELISSQKLNKMVDTIKKHDVEVAKIDEISSSLENVSAEMEAKILDISEELNKHDVEVAKIDEISSSLENVSAEMEAKILDNSKKIRNINNKISKLPDEIKSDCALYILQSQSEMDLLTEIKNGYICYISDEDQYYKYKDGVWEEFTLGGGGGSGGITSEITLSTTMSNYIQISTNKNLEINYNYNSTSNKAGKAEYKVNGTLISTKKIEIGDVTFDISDYLKKGTNEIIIDVTDPYGAKDFLSFTIDVIELELTSNFDYTNIFDGKISINYIAKGNVSKTIHFVVDEREVGTEIVTTSGIQKLYEIPKQSHGFHKIKIYATCTLSGDTITSNELNYEVICIEEGNSTPIISSSFNLTKAEQYSLISIPYMVYTPNSLQSTVKLKVNDVEKMNLTVDRKEQKWNTTDFPSGNVKFTINTGSVSRDFIVDVEQVDISIEDTKESLELYLTSTNRSNNDSNKNIWQYNNIKADFKNFNWNSNGWLLDNDGFSVMRVCDGAKIEIPFKLFETDFKVMGKTIEFDLLVSNVIDYEDIIISCMDSNRGINITCKNATYKTNELEIKTYFKDNERIRVSFVIEDIGKNRLIYTYVNGIISSLNLYNSTDIFTQVNPSNILIGSNKCTIDIYNIRSYSRGLNSKEVLNNYIYDLSNPTNKIKLFNNNRIYDDYDEVLYSRILDQVPCMTIIGELPSVKGDKKKVKINYENKEDSTKSFVDTNTTIDVQGTSSQYYPKKNYKFKLSKDYKLRDSSIEENTFTIKADYMESSHSHNTGIAKIINNIYSEKVPPQQNNNSIRTCIDGFPIAVFYKENDTSQPKYFGIYNFNNDKGNNDTFGYTWEYENAQSWEICNNTSDRCLFKKSEYTNIDVTTGKAEWLIDFEARYPEDNEDYTDLKRLTDWIVSTKDNIEKFKSEFSQYFNKHYTLIYFIMSEMFAMIDSRAKNMFLSTWDGQVWYPVFYDMDTAFGLNNEGVLGFDYNVESIDTIGTSNVFNGKDSLLWSNVSLAFEEDIKILYKSLRDTKKLTYDGVLSILEGEQISKICEAQFNEDARYKYLDPLIKENTSTYLYIAQGSRINHLKYWLYNRFKYMDSKYVASEYKSNYATFRLYTPASWQGVEPNANFNITPYTSQYIGVKFGSYERYVRTTSNTPTQVIAPDIVFNDTETIIYGADRILSLGDLSNKYAGTVDVSKAIQLTELILGSNATGYVNTNLHNVSVGNNKLMRKIDITNCPNVTNTLDLSGCPAIEEVYLKGTSVKSVSLSDGGNLKKMHLPSSIVKLEVFNKPNLTELTLEGYDNINTINVDNVGFNALNILEKCNNVELVRLMNLDCKTSYLAINKLKKCKGINDKGVEVPISQAVSGKVTIAKCSSEMLEEFIIAFPYVEFNAETIMQSFTVTFKDGDGNILSNVKVIEGGEAIYEGKTPTKTSTVQYNYQFIGWDKLLKPINSDMIVNALFENILKYYTINFVNPNSGEVIESQYLGYGSLPVAPTSPEGFNCWDSTITLVDGDKTYYASYQPYPDDLSIFTFTSTTVDGINGYGCYLKTGITYPERIIFPFQYNNKPVLKIYRSSSSSADYSAVKYVTIPVGVIVLSKNGNYGAFEGFKNVTSIDLPKGLKILEDSCFDSCISLESITLPDTLEIIENYTFYKCNSLKEVTLPNRDIALPSYIFAYCSSLTTIRGIENVTSVGNYIFHSCNMLEKVYLPKLTRTSQGLFYDCPILEYAIIGSKEHPVTFLYATDSTSAPGTARTCPKLKCVYIVTQSDTEEGVDFDGLDLTGTGLNSCAFFNTESGTFFENEYGIYIISDVAYMLTSKGDINYDFNQLINGKPLGGIMKEAFKNNTVLTDVVLPDTVHTLGADVFKYSSIQSLIIPAGVTYLPSICYECNSLISFEAKGRIENMGGFRIVTGKKYKTVTLGSTGNPIVPTSTKDWNTFALDDDRIETLTIYTETGDNTDIENSPWGATNATIEYRKA